MTELEHLDVLVVGAGLSGIGAAHHLKAECPWASFAILEARGAMGGTWDLFKYPGLRSDSDMFTLGYGFRPWQGKKSIADGADILQYIKDTSAEDGTDAKIRYHHKITRAEWSTAEARWHITGERTDTGEAVELTCSFLFSCAGYYSYDAGYLPDFEGMADFGGTIVHPQAWPEDLDYAGKRVVVIGSGATAVTVVPAMARDAAHVTMLQRTPTYVLAQPRRDIVADGLRRVLPPGPAHRIARAKNITMQWLLYRASRRYPDRMRALLRKGVIAGTGSEAIADRDFAPPYAPWDQRLCIVPDGDLFTAVREGSASVVTAEIDRYVPEGVLLTDGRTLEADIVVTATGLRLKLLGGADIRRDGEPADLSNSVAWHGALLSGLPNLGVCIGYINLSWTVRSDITARLLARILRHMGEHDRTVVEPVPPADLGDTFPFMDMQSGYLRRAAHLMPRATARYPWAIRQDVMADARATNRADLTNGLTYR
jgi:monooxygenase